MLISRRKINVLAAAWTARSLDAGRAFADVSKLQGNNQQKAKDSEMSYSSATDQLKALKKGDVTSVQLLESAIAKIHAENKSINAVVVEDFESARKDALLADKTRKKSSDKPLLGLPLTVKEAFDVQGLVTTWGLLGKHQPAHEDSAVVKRLRSAGAVILGKTNVATMLGDWQTANEVYGVTNNPYDVNRTAGGSSGGSAAAVAAGFTALEFGSDLAGSLRIPAAFCGVFAHRPTYGIVPMRGFAPPMAPRVPVPQPIDQSTLGPISRTANDLKLALDLIAGVDDADASWSLTLPSPRHAQLKDFRVLVMDEHPLVPTSNEIRGSIEELAKGLEKEKVKVGRLPQAIPDLKDLAETFSALLMATMSADTPVDQYSAARTRAEKSNANTQDRAMTMSHRDWLLLDRHRRDLAASWQKTFGEWDVVLCPVAPCTAFPHDARPFEQRDIEVNGARINYQLLPLWISIATPCGLPVTTIPISRGKTGLPIGLQIIGPHLEDYTSIAFAHHLETKLGCRYNAPVLKA